MKAFMSSVIGPDKVHHAVTLPFGPVNLEDAIRTPKDHVE